MTRNSTLQRDILDITGVKPIMFNPDLARLTHSINAGLFLSQVLYWWDKKSGESLYKSVEEMRTETALSYEQQRTAQQILVNLGYIDIKNKGIPQTRHIMLFQKLIDDLQELGKSRTNEIDN